MSVLTQISVAPTPPPASARRAVALLPVADGRPAITLVSWQVPAPNAQR